MASEDCNDADPAINPDATEICDGIDNDCDGTIDEEVLLTWYPDADGDGFGDPSAPLRACEPPDTYAAEAGDCDDDNGAVNPDATEICDGIDNDCDGLIDEDVLLTFYADKDGDGYGDANDTVDDCEAPDGYVVNAEDCYDGDPSTYPGAAETCDDQDNDCDGAADEGLEFADYYLDDDGDGFGGESVTVQACSSPEGYVTNNRDCDDSDPAVHPEAVEVCDGKDDDCDGVGDLLGYWTFDAGSGGVAYDAGPFGLDGVITNATWTSDGHEAGALYFNGTNAYVTLNYPQLGAETGITISAWVKPDSLRSGSWDSIVSRGASGSSQLGCCGDSYYLGYYKYGMSWYTDTTSAFSSLLWDTTSYASHIGTWHHLVGTWDAATGFRSIYVDGIQTATDTNGPAEPFYDGTPTRIGADTNNSSFTLPFHGTIDEVKILGCALDETQVEQDYLTNWPFSQGSD